jgi:acrylyl-CoA reductase (NADPH)
MTLQESFKALLLEQKEGQLHRAVQQLQWDALPPGEVLVKVAYSSLNYKDALAITGQGKIVRRYPMVPGIDLAGTVEESSSPDFKPGDRVLINGHGLSEDHWGGYAQWARVQADWLVPLPPELTPKQAMGIATAGFTAMLCVMELEGRSITPDKGEVVVTGAVGGVGSVAVAILGKLGYRVVASTGRPEAHDYLRALGASAVLPREALATPHTRPLESAHWAGAIDTVGGQTLDSLIRTMQYGGAIAACGLAGGNILPAMTVFPFILRAVSLIGVESGSCPRARRLEAWRRLARDLPLVLLEQMIQTAPMEDAYSLSQQILQGQIRGRVVIDPNA